jgi:hypothetical protein
MFSLHSRQEIVEDFLRREMYINTQMLESIVLGILDVR